MIDADLWLKYAQADLDTAEYMQTFHRIPIEVCCYHCQQAAEKSLKALLIEKKVAVPKSHDLVYIYEECVKAGYELKDLRENLAVITDFAVNFRYPNNVELEIKDLNFGVKCAKEIFEICKEIIERK